MNKRMCALDPTFVNGNKAKDHGPLVKILTKRQEACKARKTQDVKPL